MSVTKITDYFLLKSREPYYYFLYTLTLSLKYNIKYQMSFRNRITTNRRVPFSIRYNISLTNFKQFVQTSCGFLDEDFPSSMVIVLSGQTIHFHFVNQSVRSNDVVPFFRIFLLHFYTPGCLTSSWQANNHHHLKQNKNIL